MAEVSNKDQNHENSDSDEKFEDAEEIPSCNLDLTSLIADASLAMDLFINNRFIESRTMFEKYADRSVYHALGYGTCMYIEASMTFDPADIDVALETVRKSIQVSQVCTENYMNW